MKNTTKYTSLTFCSGDINNLIEIREALVMARKVNQTSWNAVITKCLHMAERTITGHEELSEQKVLGEQININAYVDGGMVEEGVKIKCSFAASKDTTKLLEDLRVRFFQVRKSVPSASQVVRTIIASEKENIIKGIEQMMMDNMDKWSDDMLVDLHQTLQGNTARLERSVKDYQMKIEEHRVNILKMDEEIKMRGIGLQRH